MVYRSLGPAARLVPRDGACTVTCAAETRDWDTRLVSLDRAGIETGSLHSLPTRMCSGEFQSAPSLALSPASRRELFLSRSGPPGLSPLPPAPREHSDGSCCLDPRPPRRPRRSSPRPRAVRPPRAPAVTLVRCPHLAPPGPAPRPCIAVASSRRPAAAPVNAGVLPARARRYRPVKRRSRRPSRRSSDPPRKDACMFPAATHRAAPARRRTASPPRGGARGPATGSQAALGLRRSAADSDSPRLVYGPRAQRAPLAIFDK